MNYSQENDKLLTHVLSRVHAPSGVFNNLEIIITSDCNLACSYCYLYKHSDGLYPKHLRDSKVILNNLKLLIDYLSAENLYTKTLSVFSGEIWGSDYGVSVLEILYRENTRRKFTNTIVIPTNCSFVMQDKYKNTMQEYIDKFKAIGIRLNISCSMDGKYLDEEYRKHKNGDKYTDDRYNKIVDFVLSNGFGFHPMVSPMSAKHWIPNYDWFIENLEKYGYNLNRLMMLEVRDGDWNEDNLRHYTDFLTHVFNTKLNIFHRGDVVEFLRENLWLYKNTRSRATNYNNVELKLYSDRIPCSIQSTLFVRLGDLAIVPCHRTMYDKFIYGKFTVQDDRIVSIDATNPEVAIKILSANPNNCFYGCDRCDYRNLCMKGCLGAMYEHSGDMFHGNLDIPLCNMFKTKIDTLIRLYDSIDAFKLIAEDRLNSLDREHELALYREVMKLKESGEYNERHKS